MYIVSPFTPIFFKPSTDMCRASGKYMQIFAPSDEVMIQVITRSESRPITGKVINIVTGHETVIDWQIWSMNHTDKIYYHVLTALAEGCYRIDIIGMVSEPFRITSDTSELSRTTLIQYSMKDNRQRQDAVFWISDTQYFFDWRAPGGFMDDNWVFGVNNEQFTTYDNNLSEIYALETTQKTFTLGNAQGCPVWFGELLNRILCCTYVYFEGERFIRADANVPEMSQPIEGYKSYIFKQILQDIKIVDYTESENLIKIRRVDDKSFRKVANKILTV